MQWHFRKDITWWRRLQHTHRVSFDYVPKLVRQGCKILWISSCPQRVGAVVVYLSIAFLALHWTRRGTWLQQILSIVGLWIWKASQPFHHSFVFLEEFTPTNYTLLLKIIIITLNFPGTKLSKHKWCSCLGRCVSSQFIASQLQICLSLPALREWM